MSSVAERDTIAVCQTCGAAQVVPAVPVGLRRQGQRWLCCACGSGLRVGGSGLRSDSRTGALALAAVVLYPVAVLLPMIRIEQFGRGSETSIVGGVVELLSGGHVFIGLVVLLCSLVLPVGKLLALLVLSSGALRSRLHIEKRVHRLIEWTGRWSMLDVLLVAILVAALKLGDMVDVTPGPAAWAFLLCVLLSLAASTVFRVGVR